MHVHNNYFDFLAIYESCILIYYMNDTGASRVFILFYFAPDPTIVRYLLSQSSGTKMIVACIS